VRILCNAEVLFPALKDFERRQESRNWWKTEVHSVFVYSNGDPKTVEALARILTGNKLARISVAEAGLKHFNLTNEFDDFCKVMAGLEVASASRKVNAILDSEGVNDQRVDIISTDRGAVFVKIEYKGVDVFLSTTPDIIDLDAELTSQNFDVREHFLAAVPLVLYLKWAFQETCWKAPETNACLIIDDPVLKRSHGFIDFEKLLALMKRHNFSTNIAFIPWNYRRSLPTVARLFLDNPKSYSLSVHGCDHTRNEFGSSNQNRLLAKAHLAIKRMNDHEQDTGIAHDRVMVFPQGAFSNAGVAALKHTSFIGAVNNDVVSIDSPTRHATVRDVWDVAVMCYSTFPIFTRRYPWEGLENFAFDILIGKPALIVIHHDYCSDNCERLIKFIDSLNGLKCALVWRNLTEVLRGSCRQKNLSASVAIVEMYGRELRLKNLSDRTQRYLITRKESDPSSVREVCVGSQSLDRQSEEDRISFEVNLAPGETKVVVFRYRPLTANGIRGVTLAEKAKVTVRRYLCEFRDNYVAKSRYRLSRLLNTGH
jgi:hypothetical protein